MYDKTSFFSCDRSESKSLSINYFDKAFRETILNAYEKRFDSVADARFYLTLQGVDLDTAVSMLIIMEQMGMLKNTLTNTLFSPVGCGDIANAFCKIMTGNAMLSMNRKPLLLAPLIQELDKSLPTLIRMDIPGHSYIILASEKTNEDIFGYVYQSNVAYGMEDNSFSLVAWLMDPKSQKMNLSHHLHQLDKLISPSTTPDEKEAIYSELYCAQPIVPINEGADIKKIIQSFNGHPEIKYRAKKVIPQQMLCALDLMKDMLCIPTEEHHQSLEDFICKAKTDALKQGSIQHQ